MDEIRVWSVVRTQAEIDAEKDHELCLPAAGLVAYYRFNEGVAGGNNAGINSLPDLSTVELSEPPGLILALTGTASNWVTGINSMYLQSVVLCKGTVLPFGSQTITSGGVYVENFTTTQGCDSLVQLTVSLDSVNTAIFQSGNSLIAQQLGAIFQWVDCNNNFSVIQGQTGNTFTATTTGSYAAVITKGSCTDTSACFTITVSRNQ